MHFSQKENICGTEIYLKAGWLGKLRNGKLGRSLHFYCHFFNSLFSLSPNRFDDAEYATHKYGKHHFYPPVIYQKHSISDFYS